MKLGMVCYASILASTQPIMPPRLNGINQAIWLIQKDLALHFRSKNILALVFVFSLLVVLIFNFSFGPKSLSSEDQGRLTASILWTAFAFVGTITLNRSVEIDQRHGGLDAIRLTGIDPGILYLSKVVSSVIWLAVVQAIIAPLALLFSEVLDQVSGLSILRLAVALSLGTVGFCAVGVTLATMSGRFGGESLLSVILFPLIFPVVMAGSKCTTSILTTNTFGNQFWLTLLVTYSLVFLSSSYLLFEFVIEG